MDKIIIEDKIPSIKVNKEFLIELFKSINSQNPKNIPIKTEIKIKGDTETISFKKLRDFISARYLPRGIHEISVSKESKDLEYEKNVISFHFIINTKHPSDSYYKLKGYDEGKIEICKKEIKSLLDEYKNWYWFLFKGIRSEDKESKGLREWLSLAVIISFSFVTYRILNLIRGTEQSEANQAIAVVSFFGFAWLIGKVSDRFFPYLDLRIRKKKRSKFWNFLVGAIALTLLANLIWELLRLLV